MHENLLKDFFIDTSSLLEQYEEDLLKLEMNPKQKDLIDEMFRNIHSVKGNAGMLGLKDIASAGEKLEGFLDAVRERGFATEKEIEFMFSGLDTLKEVVRGQYEGKEKQRDKVETAPPVASVAAAKEENIKSNGDGKEAPADKSVTFLTFMLDEESYGIEIMNVREIILNEAITPIPKSKNFVEGVMNLRDQVIPVFDTKSRLEMKDSSSDGKKGENIIVVEISTVTTGLRVDEVTGIITLPSSQIIPPADFQGGIPSDFLYGMGRVDGRIIILLDTYDLCDPDNLLY